MPCGDGTGPMGCGPMTGKGTGACVADPTQPPTEAGQRGGAGRGRGRRGSGPGGWRNRFGQAGAPGFGFGRLSADSAPSPEEELEMRKEQVKQFNEAARNLQSRIEELEAASSEKGE
jgi:hypothetical protein